jgi:hypothetical protein
MRKTGWPSWIRSGLGALLLALLPPTAAVAQNGQAADPDWPCVQRLVPEIAGGMIWAGPPLDQAKEPSDHKAIDALAEELAARRVPIEEAEQQVESFAGPLAEAEKSEPLTVLFKATLEIINKDRASIIAGIKRFSQGERALADRIAAKNQEIEALDSGDILKRDTLTAERDWDIRIFEDRRRSLTYLCEQPVLLEQRAFALARMITGHLE